MTEVKVNAIRTVIDTTDGAKIYKFKTSESKPFIAKSDLLLAKYYRFTERNPAHIIDYGIKHRISVDTEEDEG